MPGTRPQEVAAVTRHRTAISSHGAAGRRLTEGGDGAKTVMQITHEIGADPTTVRRWLRHDHRSLWMQHWPSPNELSEEAQRDTLRKRNVHRRISKAPQPKLIAGLDRSLQKLLSVVRY